MKFALAAIPAALIASSLYVATADNDMVLVKSGPVELGAPDKNSLTGPAIYQVDSFYIDRREVTNANYQKFVKSTGHSPPAFADDNEFNQPQQPVTGVTWNDAQNYCKWAGKSLPSQMEWEKAARGGDGRLYPWGTNFKIKNAHLSGDAPIQINNYPAQDKTPAGLFGMAGGVSEWVRDVQIASGGVCGRSMSHQPNFISNDKSAFDELLNSGGKLARFAPACVVDGQAMSPEVAAHNQRLSTKLARLGKPGWGMQKCAYIKGNSFSGQPHMTKLTNRMWDYTDTFAEFVGFRCSKPAEKIGRVK